NGSEPGTKEKVQKSLLGAFEKLYTMKALTRFSVAILGCPVEGIATNALGEIRMGDVKALLLPADEAVDMRIAAFAPGSFTLDVLTPTHAQAVRFGPEPICPEDSVALRLDCDTVALIRDGR